MNREIKFRAFVATYDGKEMVDWCFLNQNDKHFNALDITNDRSDIGEVYSVMQYTGLKDKNGTDIYEGDIVRYVLPGIEEGTEERHIPDTEYIELVEFIEGCFNCETVPLYAVVQFGCEVIGNVHQNPELIK